MNASPKILRRSLALLAVMTDCSIALACEVSQTADPCKTMSVDASYVADLWRNTRGGLKTGNAFLDKFDLLATLDGGRAVGLQGLTLHGHLQYTNGHEFSAAYLGDAQIASNIEGVPTWRLFELWAELSIGAAGTHTVKAGLYDLNSEFDTIEPAKLFLNSSHGVGPDVSQSGINGPSIFPVTALALRLRGTHNSFYWQIAAIDAVPGLRGNPTRSGFHVGSDEGALMVGEWGLDRAQLGRVSLGVWRYSTAFDRIDARDTAGNTQRQHGNQGAYVSTARAFHAGQRLKLTGWLRLGVAAAAFNPFSAYSGAGITLKGLSTARPNDQLGVAIAVAHSGREWRGARAAAGEYPVSRETNIELTWRAPLNRWLTLQPDVQYIRSPGALRSARDAFAIGLRVELNSQLSR